jgi:hypothetical protein
MLVQAAAASCWVLGSSTAAAAVELSLSARRNSERASRRSAVIAFADGGPGLSLSAMPLILRCPQPVHQRSSRVGMIPIRTAGGTRRYSTNDLAGVNITGITRILDSKTTTPPRNTSSTLNQTTP